MEVTYPTTVLCRIEDAIAYKSRLPERRAMSAHLDSKLLDVRTIEIEKHGELEYWLKFFETTHDELLAAISAVGPYAGPVAVHLKAKLKD